MYCVNEIRSYSTSTEAILSRQSKIHLVDGADKGDYENRGHS